MLHSLQAVPEDGRAGQGPRRCAGLGAASSLLGLPAHFRGCGEQRAHKWPRKPKPGRRRHLKTTQNLAAPARKVRFGAVPPDPGRESVLGKGSEESELSKTKN